jgi:hypothetical protein
MSGIGFLALGSLFLLPSPARACNVPVFRYALERWAADPYEVLVYHRGPLAAEDQKRIDALKKRSERQPSNCNFTVELVDVATLPSLPALAGGLAGLAGGTEGTFAFGAFALLGASDPGSLAADRARLLLEQPASSWPWVMARYPVTAQASHGLFDLVWSGSLHDEAFPNLFDSPARRDIFRRLSLGETAVWLLLESGHPGKDETAARTLHTTLRRLEKELKLPVLTDDPADRLSPGGPPLRMAFSVLRLRRDDPAEQEFVQMLLRTEYDLILHSQVAPVLAVGLAGCPITPLGPNPYLGAAALTRTQDLTVPVAFPVFGRGRVLYALIGAGIHEDTISESAAFLAGACSCTVKRLNPGVDLLMTADWERMLESSPLTNLTYALQQSAPALRYLPFSDLLRQTGGRLLARADRSLNSPPMVKVAPAPAVKPSTSPQVPIPGTKPTAVASYLFSQPLDGFERYPVAALAKSLGMTVVAYHEPLTPLLAIRLPAAELPEMQKPSLQIVARDTVAEASAAPGSETWLKRDFLLIALAGAGVLAVITGLLALRARKPRATA